MSNLKQLKVEAEFLLEAITFTHQKNIEKNSHLIQWTIALDEESEKNRDK